jgi:hypothetical protein
MSPNPRPAAVAAAHGDLILFFAQAEETTKQQQPFRQLYIWEHSIASRFFAVCCFVKTTFILFLFFAGLFLGRMGKN